MSRGYKTLVADEFFGNVDNIDWDKVKLIDKINLEAKIGNLVDVPFNDEEKALFLKTMHTEEFSEVLNVVREILAYSRDKQEDLMNPPMPDFDDTDNDDDNEDPTSNMGHDDMEATDGKDEEQQNSGNQSSDDNEAEEDEEQTIISTNPEHGDEDFSVTDKIFRNMEKTLIPESSNFHYGSEIKNWQRHVIEHKDLMEKRISHFNNQFKVYDPDNSWIAESYSNQMPLKHNQEVEFIDYIKKAKKAIQPAVKEFEQKKAAHRWMHASTAKTGRLDVNKLHNYKLTEDIFLKTTRLADDKNHGMFMLIDYSGSMSYQLGPVLEQVIHSILFCKAVNIPFDVYSFSTNCYDTYNREYYDGDLVMDDLSMCQLIHSGLKKKELENALKWLYARTDHARGCVNDWIKCKEEDWGSTPLNQALIVSHKLIKQFRNKHNIEKVTLLSITDGDTNTLRVVDDRKIEKIETDRWDSKIKTNIDGRTVTMWGGRKGTKTLYENLRNRYDVNVMGFFVADCNSQFRNKIHDAYNDQLGREVFDCDSGFEDFRKAKIKENTKNRCIEFKDTLGYNNFFLVKGNSFNIEDEDLDNFIDSDEEVTDSQIKSAFRKMAKNKKTNKNLMTKFGEAVAS